MKSASIRDLYLNQGLTAAQIALQIGISKTVVLRKLHALGIRRETVKQMELDQPRPVGRAPLGQRIVAGKLTPDRKELKIVRLVVELRSRQNLPWKEVVKRLNSDNLRTKSGLRWKEGAAKMVFQRWNSKI